jgi:DNA topoisomerase I
MFQTLAQAQGVGNPPTWIDVWVCPFADGHIQATGRNAKGRKQYRYHGRLRERTKYQHVVPFADALREGGRGVALCGPPREKVLAAVVHLLESS